jgi:alkanesulfonate monooxygenase SsuD/methylene tetrahydromethanopterin reductase-like flavin-dependent oxidoreductase (luciferase family)
LWVACSRRETIHLAATKGLGALSFAFVDAAEAKRRVDDYYATLASEACVPAGFSVNPNVAVVTPMTCHHDEQTAIDRGLTGALFFGYSLSHYYLSGRHAPGRTNVWDQFQHRHEPDGGAGSEAAQAGADTRLGAELLEQGLGPLRGCVGTPDQVRSVLRTYQQAGVDQVIFVCQSGRNRHQHICHSLELVAKEVLPEFTEDAETAERAKWDRLGDAIAAALARRDNPRLAPEDYAVAAPGFP